MSHQGGDVPRLVAVQGEVAKDGSFPIYRHPADESPPLLPFSPVVSLIRTRVEEKLGHSVNHVLIQVYRDGTDNISEHSDKTLDIVPNTFIANVSLGAQRTMIFRTKKPPKGDDRSKNSENEARKICRVVLPHNSMCKVGMMTNMHWLHGIRQDKRIISEKSEAELAYGGVRISLTFRKIGTFLEKDQQKIWGQGAVSKKKEEARTVINGNSPEAEEIIRAFGKENHSSDFDWKEVYGKGFDVLHISNPQRLILSGDTVADIRVTLLIAQLGINCLVTMAPPLDGEPTTQVKFIDNDLTRSVVIGDLAIMFYLDAIYGSKAISNTKSHLLLARTFTRVQQTQILLREWRHIPLNAELIHRELKMWNKFTKEGPFVAGSTITFADYALWPILDELHRERGDCGYGLEDLAAYYRRLKGMDTFVKALSVKNGASQKVEVKEKGKMPKYS
jgi:hypothetical protein